MTRPNAPSMPIADHPLDSFANCHQGIIAQLDALDTLPTLEADSAQAQTVARDTLALFQTAVVDHHQEEEKELFPAVLAACHPGAEYEQVRRKVNALVTEHREIESLWGTLRPAISQLAQGQSTKLDAAQVNALVQIYHAHARFEEQSFLPLAEQLLGRKNEKMASLGLALHMRHLLRDTTRGLRGA